MIKKKENLTEIGYTRFSKSEKSNIKKVSKAFKISESMAIRELALLGLENFKKI